MRKENKLFRSVAFAAVISVLITFCICLGPTVFSIIALNWTIPKQYVTMDLDDYGNYIGNYDNKTPQKFITAFFPEEIEETFTNVTYEYRAQAQDSYAFEAYLEFHIEDPAVFQAYVADNIGTNVSDFAYDPTFKEYVINDFLVVSPEDSYVRIEDALIGKILYSEEKQQIIYVALGVYDGGVTRTHYLCHYFNRFSIDPCKYNGAETSHRLPD